MSSSADATPVIVIDVVDDESSTDNVSVDPSKGAPNVADSNTQGANNVSVETLKIPPPAKVLKDRLQVDKDEQQKPAQNATPNHTQGELSAVQIVKKETPSNSPSSSRKRHPSKEEELKHLTEEV